MPAIKPRTTQKHLVRHITRLYRENNETLFSYAAFIGESTEYVLNQLVETVLAKDRDFQAWRLDHSGTHVPKPGSRRNGRGTSVRGANVRPRTRTGNGRRSGALATVHHGPSSAGVSRADQPGRGRRPSVWSACGSGRSPSTTPFWRSSTRGSRGYSRGSRTCTPRCGSRTPLIGLTVITALLYVAVMRGDKRPAYGPLPRYPKPSTRLEPFLVLGEQHHATQPTRVAAPTWLTIPRRGLHTGVMILGAVGTGKTSACMYPYVDQLLAWRAASSDEKIGGLVLEVKGDFCAQVRRILADHGRADDYIEIGLDSPYCYNPLHNDLEPYALAYSIATLLNNLYGRGKEPFWQQAYTDLVKFLILLRKVVDGYTTLAEIYHYAIDESLIERDIERGEQQFGASTPRVRVAAHDYHLTLSWQRLEDLDRDAGRSVRTPAA